MLLYVKGNKYNVKEKEKKWSQVKGLRSVAGLGRG